MVQLKPRKEDFTETFRHGVATNVAPDSETKEEKKHHCKSHFGRNMFLKNKRYENYMEDMEKTDEPSKNF